MNLRRLIPRLLDDKPVSLKRLFIVYIAFIPFAILFHWALVAFSADFFRIKEIAVEDTDFSDIYYHTLQNTSVSRPKNVVLINTGSLNQDSLRQNLIRIIDKVDRYHPKGIGLDMIFIESNDRKIDAQLIKTINTHKVVIGEETEYDPIFKGHVPQTLFGSINLPPTDASVRFYYNYYPDAEKKEKQWSFGRRLYHNSYGLPFPENEDPEMQLKYSSLDKGYYNVLAPVEERKVRKYYFPAMEGTEFLKCTRDTLSNLIRDKIVIIGMVGSPDMNNLFDITDRHKVPVDEDMVNREYIMPGSVIHANAVEMLINNDHLYHVKGLVYHTISYVILLLYLYVFLLFDRIRYLGVYLFVEILFLIGSVYGLIRLGIWLMNYNIHINTGELLLSLALLIEFKIFAFKGYEYLKKRFEKKEPAKLALPAAASDGQPEPEPQTTPKSAAL